MNTFIKKLALIPAGIVLIALAAVPAISSADSNYRLSSTISGFTFVNAATASTICRMLPDAVAATVPFCVWVGGQAGSTATVSNITVTNKTANGAMVSWTTSVPTTTMLWYAANPNTPTILTGYADPNQGYTTNHWINLSNINTALGYNFMVGGQGTNGAFVNSMSQGF